MLDRHTHNITVKNKRTGKIHTSAVEISGTIEDAKAHITKTPPSVGAPDGFEIIEDAPTASVESSAGATNG